MEKESAISNECLRDGSPLFKESHCGLCGNGLLMDIEYIPFTRFVVERAECPSCHTVNRLTNHSVQ